MWHNISYRWNCIYIVVVSLRYNTHVLFFTMSFPKLFKGPSPESVIFLNQEYHCNIFPAYIHIFRNIYYNKNASNFIHITSFTCSIKSTGEHIYPIIITPKMTDTHYNNWSTIFKIIYEQKERNKQIQKLILIYFLHPCIRSRISGIQYI